MTMRILMVAALALSAFPAALAQKQDMDRSIRSGAGDYWKAALRIYEWAEVGYQEEKSSALLASLLEDNGFRVRRGVADIPTAFTAEFGQGSPVIGILGEFDALPGLTQKAVAKREPHEGQNSGHGCGHHLFGTAAAAAAIGLAEQIRQGHIAGTVRFYGTPAEEGGSGKVFMVRAGLFKDVDAVLTWHPADKNAAGASSNLARIAVKFRFHGRSAHAAASPERGRSALDAVELTNHAAQLLREHTPDFTRIHHVITAGGGAPNVIPDFAEVYYYVRHPDATVVKSLYKRLELCAQAGALATETRLEIDYQGGIHNLMPNQILSQVFLDNLRELNDLDYTAEEMRFARALWPDRSEDQIRDQLRSVIDIDGQTSKGSTDVGDVSWVTPTAEVQTATWAPGTAAHSWQAVACGGTTIARKGMMLAARTLAASGYDLFERPETLRQAREELLNRLQGHEYSPMLQPNQPPPLDYRKPAKR